MMKLLAAIALVLSLALPVSALELEAPAVPKSGEALMPRQTQSFSQGLSQLLQNAVKHLRPDLVEALRLSMGAIAAMLLISVLQSFSGNQNMVMEVTGTAAIAGLLIHSTGSMIRLGAATVQEMSEYGKLLFPVMTTAMAAQGGITASAALYAGTAIFDALLSSSIVRFFIPMVYLFLVLAIANSAVGEDILKRMRDFCKVTVSWFLKTVLTVFTTYMSITGVVSGTTDAAALKATKMTISTVVPVVGSILSDASEAVLVSAGLAKNAAGIYGILAILAVCLQPFLRIAAHYLVLKTTGAVCALMGSKRITALIDDFCTAMGLLLAMTGAVCLLSLISIVCFLKVVG